MGGKEKGHQWKSLLHTLRRRACLNTASAQVCVFACVISACHILTDVNCACCVYMLACGVRVFVWLRLVWGWSVCKWVWPTFVHVSVGVLAYVCVAMCTCVCVCWKRWGDDLCLCVCIPAYLCVILLYWLFLSSQVIGRKQERINDPIWTGLSITPSQLLTSGECKLQCFY